MATMKNKFGLSRNIPEHVKAEVRKACNYGCVLCGRIPYHYDHLNIPYAEAKEHAADDIVLLCVEHHDAKTRNIISADIIESARKSRKAKDSYTRFKLPATSPSWHVNWCGTIISDTAQVVKIGDENVLAMDRSENPLEPILLSGVFRDRIGAIICRVQKNEFISRAQNLGDLKIQANRFEFRNHMGVCVLSFKIDYESIKIQEGFLAHGDGFFWGKGDEFIAGNMGVVSSYKDCKFRGGPTAFDIENNFKTYDFRGISYDNLKEIIGGGINANGLSLSVSGLTKSIINVRRLRPQTDNSYLKFGRTK
jgi:hypothetical protein